MGSLPQASKKRPNIKKHLPFVVICSCFSKNLLRALHVPSHGEIHCSSVGSRWVLFIYSKWVFNLAQFCSKQTQKQLKNPQFSNILLKSARMQKLARWARFGGMMSLHTYGHMTWYCTSNVNRIALELRPDWWPFEKLPCELWVLGLESDIGKDYLQPRKRLC